MADLISVADGAYPQASYDFLPSTVKVWAGYVGGHTPHAWSQSEVADLEATGRQWWGIWTAPVGRALTSQDAHTDAAGMVLGLQKLGYDRARPALYDVEYSSWAANPSQTNAAANLWCSLMRDAGYPHAYWYGPVNSEAQWLAHWTGIPPTTLPPGVVGIQYDHALSNDRYDISRFDPSLLTPNGGTDMALTSTDLDAMFAHQVANPKTGLTESYAQRVCDTQTDAAAAHAAASQAAALAAGLKAELDQVKEELDALKAAGGAGGAVSGTFTLTGSGTVS